jgi:hypothetical protein
MRIKHLNYHHAFLMLFFALQLGFWHATTRTVPRMDILPTPLSSTVMDAVSFGDPLFPYRIMAFQLTNAGDTFGRSTSLRDYQTKPLVAWLDLLSPMDKKSYVLPFLAAYYYGQSQNTELSRAMALFLERRTKDDLEHIWWWRIQGIYIAMHKLHDKDLALRMAEPLAHLQHVPLWVKQYPAFIHEKRGEMDAARNIIENILKDTKNIPAGELSFMRYFVEERIKQLDKLNKDAAKRLPVQKK